MTRGRRAFAAIAVMVMVITTAACGGSGALSDEEYFQKVSDARQDARSRAAGVVFPALDPSMSRAEVERVWKEALDAQVSIARDNASAFDAISAPKDLRRLHNLYVEAAAEQTAALTAYEEQRLALLKDGRYDATPAATGRVEDAAQALVDLCTDLQDAASERKITVDLQCPAGTS